MINLIAREINEITNSSVQNPVSASSDTFPDLINLLSFVTLNWALLLKMMYCNTWIYFGTAETNDCIIMAILIWSTASEHISRSAKAPNNSPKNSVGKHHHNYISHTVFLDPFVRWNCNMGTVDCTRASALNTIETGFSRTVGQDHLKVSLSCNCLKYQRAAPFPETIVPPQTELTAPQWGFELATCPP